MAKYWVTFRLTENLTRPGRYRALTTALSEIGSFHWSEPTSFVAFESNLSLEQVGLYLKRAVDPNIDLVLVGLSYTSMHCYVGNPVAFQNFHRHFPGAKKV